MKVKITIQVSDTTRAFHEAVACGGEPVRTYRTYEREVEIPDPPTWMDTITAWVNSAPEETP